MLSSILIHTYVYIQYLQQIDCYGYTKAIAMYNECLINKATLKVAL